MGAFKWLLKVAAGAVVVVPACFYVGLAASEWTLSKDFKHVPGTADPLDNATKARIVQLAKERQKALQQRQDVDARIVVLEKKIEAQARAEA